MCYFLALWRNWKPKQHTSMVSFLTQRDSANSTYHKNSEISHFDNHPLLTRPISMDANARTHVTCNYWMFTSKRCCHKSLACPVPIAPIWTLLSICGTFWTGKLEQWTPQHRILPNWKLLCIESGVRYPNIKFNICRVCRGVSEQWLMKWENIQDTDFNVLIVST